MSVFPYEDILYMPHHVSTKHPPMPASDRAAQFSPFAALTGHDAAIQETGRLTDIQVEQSEELRTLLDRKQQYLATLERPEVTVTYFLPDGRKDGGAYVTATGQLKRIDPVERVLILVGGQSISLDDITDLNSPELIDLS